MKCLNCEREVYGFWKYGVNHVCSMACLRKAIRDGKISRLYPPSQDKKSTLKTK